MSFFIVPGILLSICRMYVNFSIGLSKINLCCFCTGCLHLPGFLHFLLGCSLIRGRWRLNHGLLSYGLLNRLLRLFDGFSDTLSVLNLYIYELNVRILGLNRFHCGLIVFAEVWARIVANGYINNLLYTPFFNVLPEVFPIWSMVFYSDNSISDTSISWNKIPWTWFKAYTSFDVIGRIRNVIRW